MGFSVAAAAAILFAGAIVSFAILAESVKTANETVHEAQGLEGARVADALNTRISLINGSANGTIVDLNLTNNGSVVIHVRALEILVNGTLYTGSITLSAVAGSTSTNLWAPGQVLRLTVGAPVPGPASVKIVTETGYTFQGTVS